MNSIPSYKMLNIKIENSITHAETTVSRFVGKKFVFTIQTKLGRFKILQLIFTKSDSTIIASIPYFKISHGIVATLTLPHSMEKIDLDMKNSGKVTSNIVKYSHHPDGQAHFSLDGRSLTEIRKKSAPLSKLSGHIFSVRFQGLEDFERADASRDDAQSKPNRTVLNFDHTSEDADSFAVIASWNRMVEIANNNMTPGKVKIIGPMPMLQFSAGEKMPGIFVGPPEDSPFAEYVLRIGCLAIPKLTEDNEPVITFLGGIDDVDQTKERTGEISFILAKYPCADFDELKKSIGSIDFNPSELLTADKEKNAL